VFPSHVRLSSGNLAAWSLVQKLKSKGGLGVINLRLQNDALLMKHLQKFYNNDNIPWVQLIWIKYYIGKIHHSSREVGSFWWKDVLRLSTLFRGIAKMQSGGWNHCNFLGRSLVCRYPCYSIPCTLFLCQKHQLLGIGNHVGR